MNSILKESFEALKRRRNLVVFFAAAHIVFLVFGQWSVSEKIPFVLDLRAQQLKEIQNLSYLKPLTGILASSLTAKILYTFLFNLLVGAFFSTTLTGAIFFLPYLIAVLRSFIIGILIYGMDSGGVMLMVFYGTFLLEFGAYCISSAVGMDIGLSLMWPMRKKVESRKEAVWIAARDGVKLYLLVIIILFIAAVWEMSWIHYLGPLKLPDPGQ